MNHRHRNYNRKSSLAGFVIWVFWKIFPFLAISITIGFLFLYAEDDPTYYFICMPIVILSAFPFFVTVSYRAQWSIRNKYLRIPDARDRRLGNKMSLWTRITLLMWVSTFLIGATIAITCITIERLEWGTTEFSQPVSLSVGSGKHTLLSIFDIIIRVLFYIPFVALVLAAIYLARTFIKRKKRGQTFWNTAIFVSIASFIFSILLIGVLSWSMCKITRTEVKKFLAKASSGAVVKIDGQEIKEPSNIINELAKVAPLPAHHSHDINRIRIDVINGDDNLTLELGRDSQYDDEYWVFYPSFRHLSVNEIGKIRTSLFSDYPSN